MAPPRQNPEQAGRVAPLRPRPARRGEDFFVAGGPVAADRGCYIARATDRQLHERLRGGEYCHVIAPRYSGKSSLVARTASRLRAEGCLAAIVDLSQLGSRDGSTEVGRWYYGLAYRVVRDLRLKLDLQAWWQERMPLAPAQRLGEFFWEIVVGATRAPVIVFLDEIDSVEQLDYATDLFNTVRACHDARAAEPEYERLSFVLLGTALPAGTAARASLAATEIGLRLDLPDFRFDEARPLAQGLGLPSGDAERALYRILYWTGGHPFLTQKLCQAVARNAARIHSDESVDRLVAARFFARNAVSSESSMSRVLDSLERAGRLGRRSLRLYRRIRRGRKPKYDVAIPEHELLRICGLVTVTSERRLVVRNRIYAQVFTHHWARRALPRDWRRIGRLAAVMVVSVGALWAYTEVLPKPYEETLRVGSVELDEAYQAWDGLRRIPGFAPRADRLLARVLTRHSGLATSWLEAERIDARLRALPGYQARADALLVEFWERRATAAEAEEQRDEALLYRLRAYEAGPTADAGRALELAGGDHRRLLTVIRPDGPIEAFAPLADGRRIVTVSAGNVVDGWDSRTGLAEPGARLELLAEEFITLRRRLSLEAAGSVAALSLELALEHPRMADLSLALTSPSGKRVEWSGSRARAGGEGAVFDESNTPDLRALRGEPMRGSWLLEVEDRQKGESGLFAGWTLRTSAAHRAQDRLEHPLLLPDPTPSSSVRVAMSPQGTVVAATPRNPQARGRLRTWRVEDGDRLASIAVGAGERWIGFAGEDRLMLVESSPPGQRLRVLAAASGDTVLEHRSRARFAAGPEVSPDASHIAVAEATPRQVWIRDLATGRETFRMPAASEPMAVAVAAEGRLLAVAEPGHGVRLWRVADRRLLGEFPHNLPVVSISFDAASRWLVTADAARRIRIWDIASPGDAPVLARPAGELLQYGFDETGDLFAALGHARGYEVWKLPEGLPFGPVLRHGDPFLQVSGGRDARGASRLAFASGGRLVAGQATSSLRVWRIAEEGAPADMPRVAPVVALASSGLRVAAGLSDGRVVLRARDPESLVLRQAPVTTGEYRHGEEVTALAFSPDGSSLVSVGAEGSVLLWDAATGRNVGALFHHGGGRVEAADLGPDGRLLVTAGELGARVWDAAAGSPGHSLGPGRKVSAIVLDPSGRRAFTGTPAGEIESWDLESGERLWSGTIQAPVARLAVSSDGQRLAVAAENGLVQTWALEPGSRPLATLLAAPVTGLQFSPDGAAILAQTPAWMHRLGEVEGRLTVLASRMLPGAAPPGAWRSAVPDGLRVVLVGGPRSETLSVLDFDRAPLPPEDWVPQLDDWQRRLKLYFDADGGLRSGLPAVPVPAFQSLPAEAADGIPETLRAPPGN